MVSVIIGLYYGSTWPLWWYLLWLIKAFLVIFMDWVCSFWHTLNLMNVVVLVHIVPQSAVKYITIRSKAHNTQCVVAPRQIIVKYDVTHLLQSAHRTKLVYACSFLLCEWKSESGHGPMRLVMSGLVEQGNYQSLSGIKPRNFGH